MKLCVISPCRRTPFLSAKKKYCVCVFEREIKGERIRMRNSSTGVASLSKKTKRLNSGLNFQLTGLFFLQTDVVEPGQLSVIALGYVLDDQGFLSWQGQGILLFTTASRPALGSTQPPIKSVRRTLFLE
jgi:hypothetical protein